MNLLGMRGLRKVGSTQFSLKCLTPPSLGIMVGVKVGVGRGEKMVSQKPVAASSCSLVGAIYICYYIYTSNLSHMYISLPTTM